VSLWIVCAAHAGKPSTQASDPALDWMLSHATTSPATRPTTAPVSPLVDPRAQKSRSGTITLSDGSKLSGEVSTTAGKPLRIYDEDAKQYVDVPIEKTASIKGSVVWERDEPEWQYKLSGSDEKIYSGKTYPARELRYSIQTTDGDKISGEVAAPIYLKQGDERKTFILHKRDKGEAGQTLKQLVYVQSLELK
jgi:hypothetical protein